MRHLTFCEINVCLLYFDFQFSRENWENWREIAECRRGCESNIVYVAVLLGVVSVLQSVGRVQLKLLRANEVNNQNQSRFFCFFNNFLVVSKYLKIHWKFNGFSKSIIRKKTLSLAIFPVLLSTSSWPALMCVLHKGMIKANFCFNQVMSKNCH